MNNSEVIEAINVRYSALAGDTCCLSCGGAAAHGKPMTGEICLDLGSGRGTDVLRMAEAVGPSGRAYGVDASDGMLEKARQTAERLGVTNVQFFKGDLGNLPLPSESVDLVISNCTINHAAGQGPRVAGDLPRPQAGRPAVVSDIYATAPVPAEYAADPQAIAECWAGAADPRRVLRPPRPGGFRRGECPHRERSVPEGKDRRRELHDLRDQGEKVLLQHHKIEGGTR